MKLSLKFFCIAYIIVLLSTGAGGFFIIKSVNDTVWQAKKDRVSAAAYYAADSFTALSESVYIETDNKIRELTQQIKSVLDSAVNELKTPMTAIMGYAQLLDSYKLEPQERKEAAQAVYGEAKRLERLSRQMLDLYVLRNESVEFEEIGLSEIGKQLKTTLEFLSEKYRVPFSVGLGSETVLANRELLLSLLYNLADNAFKASEPESPIEIYSAFENGKVKITVCDRGRGISKESIALITEPFYREDKSRSRALGGAGLGLSLSREIAEIHGTSLCFESEKGKGTAVSFALRKVGAENENA